jgi:hypothetical protein
MTRLVRLGLLLALASLSTACATTAPSPEVIQPISADLSTYASIAVSARSGTPDVTTFELERMSEKIVAAINQKRGGWARAGSDGPLLLDLEVTRYERGNAFARFMLAGLGQMHIDGLVTVRDPTTQREVGRYSVSKTFAWGGMYGGMTDIAEVEDGFAQAVADGVGR